MVVCARVSEDGQLMRDNGVGTARVFVVIWAITWALLAWNAFSHIHGWHQETPFVTRGFLVLWSVFSLVLGFFGSLAAWWQTTAERNPWRLLTLWQAIGWMAGNTFYILVVVGYYEGVMLAVLMALDATVQHFSTLGDTQNSVVVFDLLGFRTVLYLVTVSYLAVAVTQTLVVGMPMARWIISHLDAWLRLEDEV